MDDFDYQTIAFIENTKFMTFKCYVDLSNKQLVDKQSKLPIKIMRLDKDKNCLQEFNSFVQELLTNQTLQQNYPTFYDADNRSYFDHVLVYGDVCKISDAIYLYGTKILSYDLHFEQEQSVKTDTLKCKLLKNENQEWYIETLNNQMVYFRFKADSELEFKTDVLLQFQRLVNNGLKDPNFIFQIRTKVINNTKKYGILALIDDEFEIINAH